MRSLSDYLKSDTGRDLPTHCELQVFARESPHRVMVACACALFVARPSICMSACQRVHLLPCQRPAPPSSESGQAACAADAPACGCDAFVLLHKLIGPRWGGK